MNSSKTLEKKAFLQHYALNRANVNPSSIRTSCLVIEAEQVWNEIERKCKNVHRKN